VKILKTDFDDSALEGIVEKYSWQYPEKFIYVALVDNGRTPSYVYEHIVEANNEQGYKKHATETSEKAKELYDNLKKMYNLEFDEYYYSPEHYGKGIN
jgi:hypothetical protein